MGLFTQSKVHSFKAGKEILAGSLFRYRMTCGRSYGIDATLNEDNLRACCNLFDEVSKLGFPKNPGPFKRLAGLAVLSQVYPVFDIQWRNGQATDRKAKLVWNPRLTIWCLPDFAEALTVNGDASLLKAFDLPTRHFQVEFIGMLRNFAFGQGTHRPSTELLLERVTAVGLAIEASAYVTLVTRESSLVRQGSAGCLDLLQKHDLLHHDMIFNDPEIVRKRVGVNSEEHFGRNYF